MITGFIIHIAFIGILPVFNWLLYSVNQQNQTMITCINCFIARFSRWSNAWRHQFFLSYTMQLKQICRFLHSPAWCCVTYNLVEHMLDDSVGLFLYFGWLFLNTCKDLGPPNEYKETMLITQKLHKALLGSN